ICHSGNIGAGRAEVKPASTHAPHHAAARRAIRLAQRAGSAYDQMKSFERMEADRFERLEHRKR
ncbi:MAG: hypothetical protein AB7J19_16945, partial [Beijerinckiaceae bacterium]